MPDLELSVAVGNYDRVRPLTDGTVRIDGVSATFLRLDPEEIFFRAFRHADFDICELSLSSFAVKSAAGDCPYVGVPVFPSRAFRHTSIYIRTDRGIAAPADLKGKRVGVPEYQLTANVWVRLSRRITASRLATSSGCAAATSSRAGSRRSASICRRTCGSRRRRRAPPSRTSLPRARSTR